MPRLKSDGGRGALRTAIRIHPDFVRHFPAGSRALQNLSMRDLYSLARSMGLDPAAITAKAREEFRQTLGAPATAPSPKTWSDDDQGQYDPPDESEPDESEPEETVPPEPAEEEPAVDAAIESEVRAIREAVTERGFSALDERLRALITEARKPPVTIHVPAPVVNADGSLAIMAQPTGQTVTWLKAFGITTKTFRDRTAQVWDGAHPDTPKVDPLYVWPERATALALTEIAAGENVYAYGPAGTGKTQWAEQLAARLGRPFALISCDSATDGPTLVGMTVPRGDSVAWQDGQLTRAIQIPGCVVCIDEPSIARPGALFAMQNMLANRVLWISETGRRVPVAQGVIFIACDNTNGMGGGARRGYTDTQRLNLAYLDRFGARIDFTYLPTDAEARVIASRTHCTIELAELLVKAAALTRAAADMEQLTNGLGLRRLLAWARLLTAGHSVEDAFAAAIINASPDQDRETLRQQCSLAVDKNTVANALHPQTAAKADAHDPSVTNPTEAGRKAAREFALFA